MSKLYIIHALDETTSFLNIFNHYFNDSYYVIEPNSASVEASIKYLEKIPEGSFIVFLGHGDSNGLHTPESDNFRKYSFINKSNANKLFENRKILLLSCRSNEFIVNISSSNCVIGFGNIISSKYEANIEAEVETGYYRNLTEKDISFFNTSYCSAIINALQYHINGKYCFFQIPLLIEFCMNQKINEILLDKKINNRVEIATLLFEFRNEMVFKNIR